MEEKTVTDGMLEYHVKKYMDDRPLPGEYRMVVSLDYMSLSCGVFTKETIASVHYANEKFPDIETHIVNISKLHLKAMLFEIMKTKTIIYEDEHGNPMEKEIDGVLIGKHGLFL